MNDRKSIILEMMKDFLYYGYGLKTFKKMKYPICESFTDAEINELWKKALNIMSC